MRLFLDENVDGTIFVGVLEAAGVPYVRMRDRFAQGTQDGVWIPGVASEDLIIVTRDTRTRRNATEVAALVRARARVVYLRQGRHDHLAQNLANAYPRVVAFFERHEPPVAATLTRPQDPDRVWTGEHGALRRVKAFDRWAKRLLEGGP